MKRVFGLFLGVLMLLIFTGCSADALTGIKQIHVNELPERMALSLTNDDGAVYIDVRERYEYDDAHIEGFKNVPLSSFDESLKELPMDKEIIIICRSGNRSMQAASKLKDNGFKDITNVAGAMVEWEGPVVSNN